MPIYEYECPKGHYFRRVESVENWRDRRPCEHRRCKAEAEQILRPSFRRETSIEPVLIFRSATGKIRIPGSNSARTPKGYERIEIRDIQTLAKFDKGYREQLRRESSDLRAIHDEHFAAYQRQSRSELRQAMAHMNPFGRALAEYAMRKSDERRRPNDGDYEAGFSVLNYDQSNREAHRDSSTNWRPRQV